MKKLFIFSAALLQSAVLFAQQPVKQNGQPTVQLQTNGGISQTEAQHAEHLLQMQEIIKQQNGNLSHEPVHILPIQGAVKPYLIMHK